MGRSNAQPRPAAPAGRPAVRAGATGGELAGSDPLARLNQALRAFKLQAIAPLLNEAVVHLAAERHREAGELALQALNIDEGCAAAWHLMAVCRERAGDLTSSLKCYDRAFALDPEDEDIAYNLGHLAFRMDMKPVAEQLFRRYLEMRPDSPDGANNLACALRDQLRFGEAIEVARAAIQAHPADAMLWNTLGTILTEQGELATAVTFFDEALRLDPDFAKARYNRANAYKHQGDFGPAIADCEAALASARLESDVAAMGFARATMLVASGELERGWEAYEARFHPQHADVLHFVCDRSLWTPDDDLNGKSLLVFAEQGLGDEVLFANLIPDLIEALGEHGKLTLAVEPRLVALFQRSFPGVRVGPHVTGRVDHYSVRAARFVEDMARIDLWAPLGSLLRRFRPSVAAFPDRASYLAPDPARVAHWRGALDAAVPGLRVGLVWKSLKVEAARARFYSPFAHLRPLLTTPGVGFVNLQYGDCTAELEAARREFGVDIWSPPGLNLKDDLDEVAALSRALDLVVGPPNATTNIAAACGAPVWMVTTPGTWPECGTDRYPWYPTARLFRAFGYNRWAEVMQRVADALRETAAAA